MQQSMDVLYYSNYCPHSRKVVDFVSKSNLINKLNCICVDKRTVDPKSYQLYIQKENGKYVLLPPNVHSVPALLIAKQNYTALFGKDAIIEYLDPIVSRNISHDVARNGEPMAAAIGSASTIGVASEKFTFYNGRDNDVMSANSIADNHSATYRIQTPADNYKTDRLNTDAGMQMMDGLLKQREHDVPQQKPDNPFGF